MNPPVQIDVINESKTPLGVDLNALVSAIQTQVTRDFAPIWGTPARLDVQTAPRSGVWRLIMLDDADQADALGYHELTPDGFPQGKVFVKTTLQDHENPTVTASHELLEMLVDPMIDQTSERVYTKQVYAKEVCDAVEEVTYAIDGIIVSDFQTPAWFGMPSHPNQSFDFLGRCRTAWQLLPGGYMSVEGMEGWTQVFASVRAADRFSSARKWRPQARESGIMRRSTR